MREKIIFAASMMFILVGCNLEKAKVESGDLVPPLLIISNPISATAVSTSPNILISGTAQDNIGVVKITYSLNASPAKDISIVAGQSVDFSENILGLSPGNNTLELKAYDEAGNSTPKTVVIAYSPVSDPDTIAPILSVSAPSAKAVITSASLTATGTATDATAVTKVTYQLNAKREASFSITSGASVSFSRVISGFVSGANTLVIRAYDAAGNSSQKSMTVTYEPPVAVDTSPPVVSVSAPQNVASSSVTFSGTMTDAIGVSSASYILNDGAETNISVTPSSSITVSQKVLGLVSGSNTVVVRAYDDAGNQGEQTLTVVYTPTTPPADTTAPVLSVTSPTANSSVSSVSISLSGTATDAVAVSKVSYILNGGAEASIAITAGTSVSFSKLVAGLASGANTLLVRAYDAANNKSEKSLTITYNPPSSGSIKLPPTGKVQWDWQIGASSDTAITLPSGVNLLDLDGFTTSASKVASLKSQGVYTVCYLDVGSYEDGRPDSADYPEYLKIYYDSAWGEWFLDVTDVFKTNSVLAKILRARFQMCKDKGFDAVEPDNLQNDENAGGKITLQQQLDFNGWIADTVHEYGLAVFQKNGPDKILGKDRTGKMMVDKFDAILNEECQQYNECAPLAEYTKRGKLALNTEYTVNPDCTLSDQLIINTIRKDLNLTGGTMSGYKRTSCP